MRDALAIQTDCMNAIKDYSRSVSETQPMIGRIGALPISTIDVVSQALAVQIITVQTIAKVVFETFDGIFLKQEQIASHIFRVCYAPPTMCLYSVYIIYRAPVDIITQTIEVLKDPVNNSHYKSLNLKY